MGVVENVCPWVKKVLVSVEKYKISKVKQNNKHITPLLTSLEIAHNTPHSSLMGDLVIGQMII